MREIDRMVLEAGVLMFAEIVHDSPAAAYMIAAGFLRAAERAANGKPLTDPNKPEALDRSLNAVADAFLKLLPGLHVADPPEPPAKA